MFASIWEGETSKLANMTGDIVNRIKRLPKPASTSQALQPIFEAVSNSIHAITDLYGEESSTKGKIKIEVTNLGNPDDTTIEIDDNGIGLEEKRFEAFKTTDTAFKISRGGKGVGRLLWLDAFSEIYIESVYKQNEKICVRQFRFVLRENDQIDIISEKEENSQRSCGTFVRFRGLRISSYRKFFPTYAKVFTKHFGSHFLSDFIMGRSPLVMLGIDGSNTDFPSGITDMLDEERPEQFIETDEFGKLKLSSFIFKKEASSDFDGMHQLHLIAGRRTVTTRKIDGLLGLSRFGEKRDLVYHGCVEGEFLEERVNQERTGFNFGEDVANEIARLCAQNVRSTSLKSETEEFDATRLASMNNFLSEYPSFGFASPDHLLDNTPKNATKPEDFARALVPHRIRRDQQRRKKVQSIIDQVDNDTDIPADFTNAVRDAADDVRAEEQRQLTEYILRRKLALDVLEVLIRKIRKNKDKHLYHLEGTLHQFICPMRVRGDDYRKIEYTDHDLWIIDERLAFARYFASDVTFSQLIEESKNTERPDLLIFDKIHGLGIPGEDPLERVMLIELKHPNREDYEDKYLPGNQIMRYLDELSDSTISAYNGEDLRISKDCVFHCFVVADIVGKLKVHTRGWETTSNGRGKWMALKGDYRGSIEIIEWKDLIKDARSRNRAFVNVVQI